MDTVVRPAISHSPWRDLTVQVKSLASYNVAPLYGERELLDG